MEYANLKTNDLEGEAAAVLDPVPEATSAPAPSARRRLFISLGVVTALAAVAAIALSQGTSATLTTAAGDDVVSLVGGIEGAPIEAHLPVILRDFQKASKDRGHPDMEPSDASEKSGLVKGMVEATLGADKKPVYKGGKGLHSKAAFDQWYNDDPTVNRRVEDQIVLTPTKDGTLVMDKHDFFPVDGKGWKDVDSRYGHNYYFTLEAHKIFTYVGGEVFTFRGDDDLWVFINNKLVIDLGGMHLPETGSIKLDSLGLEKNSINELHLFFAERHTKDSNFRIETSIRLDAEVTTSTTTVPSEQCCLISVIGIDVACAPQDQKSWYHFWCM